MKIFDVRASVKDWIRVGDPNRVAIPVTFAPGYPSFDQCTASQQHVLHPEIVITHLRRDLGVTVVSVNDVGIVKNMHGQGPSLWWESLVT